MTRPVRLPPVRALIDPTSACLRNALTVAANGGMGDSVSNAHLWEGLRELRARYGSLPAAMAAARARDQRRNRGLYGVDDHG